MRTLRLDFETYSEADIFKVGAWAYSAHPSTEVLMIAWAFDDDEPQIWLPGEEEPKWLWDLRQFTKYNAPELTYWHCQIAAWNDFFELAILKNVMGIENPPPPEYWVDTAGEAAALALPRGLANCGAALGLPQDSVKNKEGKKLIQIFSVLKRSMKKENKGELIRTYPQDDPENFEKFKQYCIQDVIAEREISKKLRRLSPDSRKLWELDRKINLRGVHFDMKSVRHALVTANKARVNAMERVAEMTCGLLENIGSRPQFMTYMQRAYGLELENSQKEYLKRTVAAMEVEGDPEVVELIKLRLYLSKSSLAKYDKLVGIVGKTNRAHGLLRFHGASTGRWSGNLFQPQNLPRKSLDLPDLCIELLKHEDPEVIEMFFDDCLEAISLCLRGMITASPGNRLIVSDFAQIESRVLAWLAGYEEKLNLYREGLDIYKVNAQAAFKVKYENVSKEQRQIGKVIELACGYGGSVGAFQSMAPTYGVVIPDEEAKVLIKNWRNGNPKIVSYWYSIEEAAIKAVENPGTVQILRNVSFKVIGSGHGCFLFCKLPSGRAIAYHRPSLVESGYGKAQISYWGVDSMTKKYCRQRTYGGKLVENITQACAADCMMGAMVKIEDAGYPIVLTVHDEVVSDTPIVHGSLEEFNQIMEIVPDWAKGLPVKAEGYEAKRYKK